LITALGNEARAALGAKASSADDDNRALGFAKSATVTVNSLVADESTKNKQKIRQFRNASGDIYAVTWTGHLDEKALPQLLGAYAGDYAKSQQQNPPKQAVIPFRKVITKTVVVEFWNMRKMVLGKAYVPKLLPEGVKPEQISTH